MSVVGTVSSTCTLDHPSPPKTRQPIPGAPRRSGPCETQLPLRAPSRPLFPFRSSSSRSSPPRRPPPPSLLRVVSLSDSFSITLFSFSLSRQYGSHHSFWASDTLLRLEDVPQLTLPTSIFWIFILIELIFCHSTSCQIQRTIYNHTCPSYLLALSHTRTRQLPPHAEIARPPFARPRYSIHAENTG